MYYGLGKNLGIEERHWDNHETYGTAVTTHAKRLPRWKPKFSDGRDPNRLVQLKTDNGRPHFR